METTNIFGIFVFSTFHLIRDLMQIFNFETWMAIVGYRDHTWCMPYCDGVTLPLEIYGILGSMYVLKRDRVETIGLVVIASISLRGLTVIVP